MSYEIRRQIIQKYFQDHFLNPATNQPWTDENGTLFEVEYPNHILSLAENEASVAWGRFSIRNGRKIGMDVGTRSARIAGEATLQIFLPEDSGVRLAREIGDSIVEFMENIHLGTDDGVIRFGRTSVQELTPDSGWDQTLVAMPFQCDIINPMAYASGGDFIPYPPQEEEEEDMTNIIFITTLGPGVYTPSAGCKAIFVECVGGGGGSAGALSDATQCAVSGGGGAGGYCGAYIATPDASYNYRIGAGGSAGDDTPTDGGNGEQTNFASIYAGGGNGSLQQQAGYDSGGGAGGTGTIFTGDGLVVAGSDADSGLIIGSNPYGGAGGASQWSSRKTAPNPGDDGRDGDPYGGGAAGASANPNYPHAGAAGGQGAIKITEYIGTSAAALGARQHKPEKKI